MSTRVVVAEDEPLFRQLILNQLSADPDIEVVGEANNGEDAIHLAESLQPEVMLMDIEMGDGITGIEAGYKIKARNPGIGIVLLSNHKAKQFIVNSGGWSYLIKRNVRDMATVTRAVKGAAWGMLVIDPSLTESLQPKSDAALAKLAPEQLKILELMAQGYSDLAIAHEMVMEEQAVLQHMAQMYATLGIKPGTKVDPRVTAVRTYLEQTGGL